MAVINSSSASNFGERRVPSPNEQIASTAEVAVHGRCRLRCCALVAGALMVSVVAIALPVGVRVVGEKAQVAPVGNPEQAKETVWLNVFCGVTVSCVWPLDPQPMVSEVGLADKVKSGTPILATNASIAPPR